MIINVITSNIDKYNETRYILNNHNITTNQIKDINIPEIQGSGEDIINSKIEYVSSLISDINLVEDTSFEVNGMNGLPGPYIKDFFLKLGNNNFYKLASTFGSRAKEICYIGINVNGNKVFVGEVSGDIVKPYNSESDEYNWGFFFKLKYLQDR